MSILHAQDRGPQVAGVASAFLCLATIGLALRCYSRGFVTKAFGVDDTFCVISWVFYVFFVTFALLGVAHGTGQHTDNLPPAEIPVGLKWWWACEPVYVLSNMALKLSIGIMLLRIAVARIHKIIIYTVLIVTETYSTFYFFLFVLQCRPSAYFWTQYTGGKGTCVDPKITVDATYGYSAVSCWADWTFGILPAFMVWNLQMNIRTKLSVAVILAIGAIASTATIIRIPYVKDLANQADFLYATTDVAIWSTIETGIGITACSFATLRPLFRSFYARSRLMGGSSSTPGGYASKSNGRSGGRITPGPAWPLNSNRPKDVFSLGLRSDIRGSHGVTTVIGAGDKGGEIHTLKDLERLEDDDDDRAGEGWVRGRIEGLGLGNKREKRASNASTGPLARPGGWTSESKLENDSASEDHEQSVDWNSGIRKTTIHTHQISS